MYLAIIVLPLLGLIVSSFLFFHLYSKKVTNRRLTSCSYYSSNRKSVTTSLSKPFSLKNSFSLTFKRNASFTNWSNLLINSKENLKPKEYIERLVGLISSLKNVEYFFTLDSHCFIINNNLVVIKEGEPYSYDYFDIWCEVEEEEMFKELYPCPYLNPGSNTDVARFSPIWVFLCAKNNIEFGGSNMCFITLIGNGIEYRCHNIRTDKSEVKHFFLWEMDKLISIIRFM